MTINGHLDTRQAPQLPELHVHELPKPNMHVTAADAAWLREAAGILHGKQVTPGMQRQVAGHALRIAREAERVTHAPSTEIGGWDE